MSALGPRRTTRALTRRGLGTRTIGCVDMPDSGVAQDLLSRQPQCHDDGA